MNNLNSNDSVINLCKLYREYEKLKSPQTPLEQSVQRVFLVNKDGLHLVSKGSWWERVKIRFGLSTRYNKNDLAFEKNAQELRDTLESAHKADITDQSTVTQLNQLAETHNALVQKVLSEKFKPNWFRRIFLGEKVDQNRIKPFIFNDTFILKSNTQQQQSSTSSMQAPTQLAPSPKEESSKTAPMTPRKSSPKEPEPLQARTSVHTPPKTSIPSEPSSRETSVSKIVPQDTARKSTLPEEPPEVEPKTPKASTSTPPQVQNTAMPEREETSRQSVARKPTSGVFVSEARQSVHVSANDQDVLNIIQILLDETSDSIERWEKALTGAADKESVAWGKTISEFRKELASFESMEESDLMKNKDQILHLSEGLEEFEEQMPRQLGNVLETLIQEYRKHPGVDKAVTGEILSVLNGVVAADEPLSAEACQNIVQFIITKWKELPPLDQRTLAQFESLANEKEQLYNFLNQFESLYDDKSWDIVQENLPSLRGAPKNDQEYEKHLGIVHEMQKQALARFIPHINGKIRWLESIQEEYDVTKLLTQFKGIRSDRRDSIDPTGLGKMLHDKMQVYESAKKKLENIAERVIKDSEDTIVRQISALQKEVEEFQLDSASKKELMNELESLHSDLNNDMNRLNKTNDPERRDEELDAFRERYQACRDRFTDMKKKFKK
jgi:hypothetical protein